MLWIYNCYEKKTNYAKSISGKKIIFASGSNTLFGVNTIEIEKYFNIPVVNMALHVGLGPEYTLKKVKEVLREGDIVILPLEYSNFYLEKGENSMNLKYFLAYDKSYFFELNNIDKIQTVMSLTPSDLLRSIEGQIIVPEEDEVGKGYNSNTLNKNGDETFKEGYQENYLANARPFKIFDNKLQNSYGYKEIEKFVLEAKKMNVKVYITFPNTVEFDEYKKDIRYVNFFNSLLKSLKDEGYNVIGHPYDSMFPIELFYDTDKHLNTRGADLRTKKLIELLEKGNYLEKGLFKN